MIYRSADQETYSQGTGKIQRKAEPETSDEVNVLPKSENFVRSS